MEATRVRLAPEADDGFAAVLVAGEALRDEARRAVALAGGRVVEEIGWEEIGRLNDGAGGPVVAVEADGVGDELLAMVLPRVASLGGRLVVSLREEQIDLVAALTDERAQLLCRPSMAERVAALAVAGGPSAEAWRGRVREGDAERLARLTGEIARIAQVLARLAGEDAASAAQGDVADRQIGYEAPRGPAAVIDPQLVRRAIRGRRMRGGFFDASLVEDPGWDMLLDLFAAELEEGQVSVSSLCIASAVAPTTALRWIGRMTEAGLFERRPDPFDRRRAFMALTPRASEAMRAYVAAVTQAGLAIA